MPLGRVWGATEQAEQKKITPKGRWAWVFLTRAREFLEHMELKEIWLLVEEMSSGRKGVRGKEGDEKGRARNPLRNGYMEPTVAGV